MPTLSRTINNKQSTINRRGTTLVELLIVVVIVGVISSLSIGVISNRQADARDAQRKVDLESITTALELYYQQNSAYPPSETTVPLDGLSKQYSSNNTGDPWIPALAKSFIKSLPKDPKQNQSVTTPYNCDVSLPLYNYCYISRPDRQSFELWAKLEKTNDPEIHSKPGAKCTLAPPNANFNYCIKSN